MMTGPGDLLSNIHVSGTKQPAPRIFESSITWPGHFGPGELRVRVSPMINPRVDDGVILEFFVGLSEPDAEQTHRATDPVTWSLSRPEGPVGDAVLAGIGEHLVARVLADSAGEYLLTATVTPAGIGTAKTVSIAAVAV